MLAIEDPLVLAAELERVRCHHNSVRSHEGIGYVTPDDEHAGRGEAIRQARRDGLAAATRPGGPLPGWGYRDRRA
jgi:hypothetical protein